MGSRRANKYRKSDTTTRTGGSAGCPVESLLRKPAPPSFLSCPFNPPIGILKDVTTTVLESIPHHGPAATTPGKKRVLLLKPRGFCAGVVRAIDIVKIALDTFGAPIYVRREIVHNRYVVNELAEKGAIFVHEIDDVPEGQRVIYSAHGVSPAVRERSKARHLRIIDATCPLVTKVHFEAVKFARQGYSLVLIGHRDHDEIEGTLGEAPAVTHVVSNVAEVEALELPNPDRVAYLTQTTLSLDEARDIIHALKIKFPHIVDFMNKNRAFLSQLVHDIAVMHNLPAHVNRRAEGFQSDLHNVDRAHHPGAKAARLEQQHPLLTGGSPGVGTVRDGIEQSCSHIAQYTNRRIQTTGKKNEDAKLRRCIQVDD